MVSLQGGDPLSYLREDSALMTDNGSASGLFWVLVSAYMRATKRARLSLRGSAVRDGADGLPVSAAYGKGNTVYGR